MNNEEAIKEVNQHIKDSMAEWSDIIQGAIDKTWFHLMDWDNATVGNVIHIFKAIMINSATKRGIITEENIAQKWEQFNTTLEDVFGLKMVETNTDLN